MILFALILAPSEIEQVLSQTPKLDDLVTQLAEVVDVWEPLGTVLQVPNGVLCSLRESYYSPQVKLSQMLQHWLDMRCDKPTTWQTLLNALETKFVGKNSTAMKIREFLKELANYKR